MEKQKLLQTLESLHDELQSAKSVDDETRAHLVALTDDIRRLSDQTDASDESDFGPLTAQVHDLVQHFGAEHPQLSRALNQVAAALANLGI